MEIDIFHLVAVLAIILVSMTLHEVMHAFMSYWLGDDTAKLQGRLTLNPIKHIDPFLTILLPLILAITGGPIFGGAKPVPFNPNRVKYDEWGAALVALAGPLTNFVIAFILFGIVAIFNISPISDVGSVLMLAVGINLGFFVFNMIPIPPLDGSRALYALAPDFVRRGMEAVESFGLVLIFALVLLGGSVIGAIMSSGIGAVLQLFIWVFGIS